MSVFTEFPEELLLHIAGYVSPAAGLGYLPYVTLALTCRRFYVLLATWIAHDQTRLFKQMLAADAQNTKPRCKVVSSTRVLTAVLDQSTSSELNNLKNWTQNDSEEHIDPDAASSLNFALASEPDPFIRGIKDLRCIIGGTEKEFQIVLGVITRAPHLQHVHLELAEETSTYRQAARALNVCAAKACLELTVSGIISDYFEQGPFEVRGRQRKWADDAALPTSCSDVDQRLTKSTRERRKSRSLLAPLSELFSRAREPSYLTISVQNYRNPQRPLRDQISYSYKLTPIAPSLRLRLAPHPHLSSFTLRSDSLFYPNLYPLTLHLLNTARIRTLFLASSRMSLHDWGHILQSLTMPELQTLSVGHVAIAFPDLAAFLFRHPSIEKLELGSPDVTGTVKVPQGISLLPHLTALTAHREHLVAFIQLKKHGHVPSLRHFSVIVDGFDVLSPLASPDEPFLELLFQEVHFENLSIDFWTLQGYLIFVRWLLCRVRVRLDSSKLPSTSRHKFELGNLTAVSALVKQWDIGRCLTEWMKDELDAWALEHAQTVELTRNRRKADDRMLDEYLIISESLILSVCPKLENVVYHRV